MQQGYAPAKVSMEASRTSVPPDLFKESVSARPLTEVWRVGSMHGLRVWPGRVPCLDDEESFAGRPERLLCSRPIPDFSREGVPSLDRGRRFDKCPGLRVASLGWNRPCTAMSGAFWLVGRYFQRQACSGCPPCLSWIPPHGA